MTRKYLLAIAGIVIVGIVGFGAYQWWLSRQLSPAWVAVPIHSLLVVEADNPLNVVSDWKKNDIGQQIQSLPYFQTLLSRLNTLQKYPESKNILLKKKILISLHVTTRNEFDYVFYIPLSDREKESTQKLIQQFRSNTGFRTDTRTFGDYQITDITDQSSRQSFSFIFTDDLLIGSYTSFLVEDVIRKLNEGTVNRDTQWNNWNKVALMSKGPLQVYANLSVTPRFVQLFTNYSSDAGFLPTLGLFANLELTQDKNSIHLKGNTHLNPKSNQINYLTMFQEQEAQPVSCLSMIPNQTAILYHWTFSKPQLYFKKHYQYDSLYHSISRPRYFSWVANEMALAIVETTGSQPDRLLCVRTNDVSNAAKQLREVAIQYDEGNEKSSYQEKYKGAAIHQIYKPEFPSSVFGNEVNGFSQCFYIIINQYVVFGNSVQSLKNLLDIRETGDVWSQSAIKRNLFKSEHSAHFTIQIDVSHAWSLFYQKAAPHWQQIMQQYSSSLKDFEHLTMGFYSEQSNTFETEITAHYRSKPIASSVANTFFVSWKTKADTLLRMSPILVRSHINHSREVILQDAANRMYLVNQSGQILWRKWMDSPIQSEIYQIDYLKNNKLQYLFTTNHQLHILDRNGSPVAPFPIKIPATTNLHTLSMVDYDGNKEYRFLVSDMLGNLYMYDKAGAILEGWNPLHTGYRLECTPQHVRIQDKDYFVILQANGKLTLLNRRGQVYPGFPVDLKARTESRFLVETGLSPEQTHIVIVTKEGEIIYTDFTGKITTRKQLYHTSGNNVFRMCLEPKHKDWVIARLENRTIAILDKEGQSLFETAANLSDNNEIQYYNFGAGLRIVAITNPVAKSTTLYTITGSVIGKTPIHSSSPIAAVYVDAYDKLLVYHTIDRQIEVLSAKIK
ncbi:hypothetical protein QNI16_16765 [Cytophagaceae bacterium YF14B1]|uniref:DUF3352 domain-containing protein n=1 Tax=Xanthocytophaga flava TaxID=3048013 RepID=A0AAE3QRL6_9BACT|nr:DUF3352 domain-containing protein [Xanthocytophaga flavus]MDJ1482158.1 hypothetical protein [Xanthocytophaga flavus]